MRAAAMAQSAWMAGTRVAAAWAAWRERKNSSGDILLAEAGGRTMAGTADCMARACVGRLLVFSRAPTAQYIEKRGTGRLKKSCVSATNQFESV